MSRVSGPLPSHGRTVLTTRQPNRKGPGHDSSEGVHQRQWSSSGSDTVTFRPRNPTPPKTTAAMPLPERLAPLARQLAELDPTDRDLLIRAVQTQAPCGKLHGASWERLKELKGIVSLGGNAVEDGKALYEG
jgi:hypothetical protein